MAPQLGCGMFEPEVVDADTARIESVCLLGRAEGWSSLGLSRIYSLEK